MHLLPPAHQPLPKTKTSIFFEGRVAMDVARLRPFLFDPFLAQRPQEATPFSFFIAPTLTNCSLFLEATLTIGSRFGVLDSTSLVALLLSYLLFASLSVSPTVYAHMH